MSNKPQQIKINFPPNLQGGVYANQMTVIHTHDEFILDFLMVAPPAGSVTARVIVSPAHAKRIVKVLMDNIGKYEEKFGSIKEAPVAEGNIQIQ